MTSRDREKWDSRYQDTKLFANEPAYVLKEYGYLLPEHGAALELAAGLGANTLYLAQRGLNCTAWDISPVAMERLSAQAVAQGLTIECQARDVIAHPPPPQSFDLIVVSRFLERSLCPSIINALRPNGLLFYQTFIRDKTDCNLGPSNPHFLLDTNELLRLFQGLTVRVYREDGMVGDRKRGARNEACLVAENT